MTVHTFPYPKVTESIVDLLSETCLDPWDRPSDAPLLPVEALRVDLDVDAGVKTWDRPPGAPRPPKAFVPIRKPSRIYSCPCGDRCDYAARDDHLRQCRAFKEAWEEALRRLVDELTAAQVRRYISRISQYKLCKDAAAFCALAETRGDVDEAVMRLSDETYRHDMALASELHGLHALDRKLKRAYVPGTSNSDQSINRARTPTFTPPGRHRTESMIHFEDSGMKEKRLYYVE